MMGLTTIGLAALAALTVSHDPHGCREAPHRDAWDCRCLGAVGYGSAIPYHPPPLTYRPRPAYGYGSYFLQGPGYVVRGRPVRAPGPVVFVEGPPIYVDAPPVYVEPAQVYIERPRIIVRPSEVIVAPPEVHFEPCPPGADCRQAPDAAY